MLPSALLGQRTLQGAVAWRGGQAIAVQQLLVDAAHFAAALPPEAQFINLCQDRYRFSVGLLACRLRGQMSLLPPNAMPATLAQLQHASLRSVALIDDEALDTGSVPTLVVPLGHAPASASPPAQPGDDSDATAGNAVCLLTSGSTGVPQAQTKAWGALQLNIQAQASRLAELLGWPSITGLTLVATVPPQHSYGFESSVLLALFGGATFEVTRPFYPADIADTLARVPRPRALVTTPFHLKTLLLSGVELPVVDLVLSATAPLTPQLAAQAEAALGATLIEIYGCTEAGQVAARRTTAGEVWTTLGELRLQVQTTAQGEAFIVQGGHVTQPTPLADVLDLIDARRFRLLGRANDIIHVAGKRSSLAHLNFHLNRIEGVDDGAFWLPDDVAESVVRPIAFVVAPRLTAREVISALREHLEGAFVPRRVVHVQVLPREATGKLTAQAWRHFALQTLAALDASKPAVSGPVMSNEVHDELQVEGELRVERELRVPVNHPAFAGHFPGAPVLPGALLLSMILQTVADAPALTALLGAQPQIDQVKFLAPVGPGELLRITLVGKAAGVAFEMHGVLGSAHHCVLRGRMSPVLLP